MAKTKATSMKKGDFAKGGSTRMFPKMGAAPAASGLAVPASPPSADKGVAKGGKTGVMGKQRGAAPAVAGQVSPGGRGGDNSFKASGGKGHMAGFTGAQNARPK